MTAPRTLRPRLFPLASLFGVRPRPGRRRAAPRALTAGVCAFALATLALAALSETEKPEWRDPEYGHRLRQLRGWRKARPDRPLVLFVGSSRVQMGVSPADMGFADAPGEPLGYNVGYRFATPAVTWLLLQRLLDDGVRPHAVVLMVAAAELNTVADIERQMPGRGARLSDADLRRLAPYTDAPAALRRGVWAARFDPWNARREAVVSDYLRDWQTEKQRHAHEGWEGMDDYGFARLNSVRVTAESRAAIWQTVLAAIGPTLNTAPLPHPSVGRVFCDLVGRCRAAGIAVSAVWLPESPRYRALYTPATRAAMVAYSQKLTTELGVPVFAAPEDLSETDFADGFHLVGDGPAKYSRWLADTHLRPWLAPPRSPNVTSD